MAAPLIAITADIVEDRLVLSSAYAAAIEAAGGHPIILPPLPELAVTYVQRCDGFILSGGDDPIMEHWGIATHPAAKKVDLDRQTFELALLQALNAHRDKPVLGVCLGMQFMGLNAGGRLDQCLSESLPTHADHAGRKIHRVAGRIGRGEVMSNHRQAIVDAGSMCVVATAPDGVIEAIRADDRRFYLGVQWHPERTTDQALGAAIIADLVRASSGRSTPRLTRAPAGA